MASGWHYRICIRNALINLTVVAIIESQRYVGSHNGENIIEVETLESF
jgi:hypothetical protein